MTFFPTEAQWAVSMASRPQTPSSARGWTHKCTHCTDTHWLTVPSSLPRFYIPTMSICLVINMQDLFSPQQEKCCQWVEIVQLLQIQFLGYDSVRQNQVNLTSEFKIFHSFAKQHLLVAYCTQTVRKRRRSRRWSLYCYVIQWNFISSPKNTRYVFLIPTMRMGRTYKLHTDRTRVRMGFEPRTFLLSVKE